MNFRKMRETEFNVSHRPQKAKAHKRDDGNKKLMFRRKTRTTMTT